MKRNRQTHTGTSTGPRARRGKATQPTRDIAKLIRAAPVTIDDDPEEEERLRREVRAAFDAARPRGRRAGR